MRLWPPLLLLPLMVFTYSCSRSLPTPTSPIESPTPPTSKSPTDLIYGNPAAIDNSNMPITPIEDLGVTSSPPEVAIATYILTVSGLVNTPLELNYNAILQQPTITEAVLLICPGTFSGNCEWTGVPMTTLLAEAGVKPEATQVIVHAIGNYTQTFDLTDVERDGVFLAYMVDGKTLPKEHGYPIRLVVKGEYGAHWVKWVNWIEVK